MEYLFILIILFASEIIYFRIADRFNIIDKPNERSSHTQITLRGGGIIFYIGVCLFFIKSNFQLPYFFIGLSLMTLISFLDDIFSLSNKIRLSIHLASVLLLIYQIGLFSYPLSIILIALILIIGTINAYNFMDGINGITAIYSIAVLGLIGYMNYLINFVPVDLINYSFLAVLVFAFYNFRNKARCFAGDVGSVSIAFIIIYSLISLIYTTQNFIYILFISIYGIDVVWTILRRLINKENIFQAHRSHLYQYLSNEAGVNKLVVSSFYALLQLLVGLAVIFVANYSFSTQIIFSILLLSILSIIYIVVKQRLINKYFTK